MQAHETGINDIKKDRWGETNGLSNGRDNTMQWSGLRGSNSLPPPWQGGALPDELNPQEKNMQLSAPAIADTATYSLVPPIGIEPMTRGFSVPCSTD